MAIIGDPVAAGLVENLARPNGNLTGFSIVAPELGGKRLELLKEIVPNVSAVSVLLNVKNPQSQIELKEMRSAAEAMGLQLYPAEISAEVGLDEAFATINKAAVQALVVLTDPILFSQRKRAASRSRHKRHDVFFKALSGAAMSYSPSDDLFRARAITDIEGRWRFADRHRPPELLSTQDRTDPSSRLAAPTVIE